MARRAAKTFVPAVVVRGEVNGLGVVRSLAAGGVPAIVVDTTLRHAAMWSRHAKRCIVSQLSGRPFVDNLLLLQKRLGVRPVLFLTDELAVNTVSEYRAELSPYYRFRLPSHAMVTTLANKASFQRFAEQHVLLVPRAIVIERDDDIAKIARLGLPVIVKPADKLPYHLGRVERINLLATPEEASVVCRRMLINAGPLVVQEWIDGPDSNIHFSLFHSGRSSSSRTVFFGRKIAAYPPGVGSTAVCVPAPEAAEWLGPVTEKFIDVTQYEGFGSLEFKWDAQARRFVIIEPTVGRTDWQEEIATLSGLNLALTAYHHELGAPMPPARRNDAVAWRESFLHLRRGARLGVRTYDGYWRVDDPLPALAFYAGLVLRGIHRLLIQPIFQHKKPFRRRWIAWRA
jgi:D-aspartate ligase